MSEQKTMTQILSSQRVIAFNPLFADVADDAIAGLMLSQLCYWSERTDRPDGWIYKSQKEWFDSARLTRRNIETARKKLEKLGVIFYKLMGVPAIGYYKVNYLILEALVREVYEKNPNKNNRLSDSAKQGKETKKPTKTTDCRIPPNKIVGFRQTRLSDSAKQDCRIPPNKIVQNEQSITESTTESNSKSKTNTSYSAEKESDLALSKEEQELLAHRAAAASVTGKEVRSKADYDEAMRKAGLKPRIDAQKHGTASA